MSEQENVGSVHGGALVRYRQFQRLAPLRRPVGQGARSPWPDPLWQEGKC